MIGRLNGCSEYEVLSQLTVAGRAESIQEKEMSKHLVEIQETVNHFEEYIYTCESEKQTDLQTTEDLKVKWQISEEEIYKLYKSGADLESLDMEELTYVSEAKNRVLGAEPSKKIKKEKIGESLEEKIEVIQKQEDKMYLYAVSSQEPVTINNLYGNNFKGEFKKGISQYTKGDVENVLAMNGLATNRENIWAGNLLMMYDMGVTSGQVNKLQSIQTAISALDKQYGCVGENDELIKDGQVQYKAEYIHRITDDLGMVTDEHIERLLEEESEISIGSLRESIHKNARKVLEEGNGAEGQSGGSQGERTYETEEVKRQIHQIRTKLTAESAQKISMQMPLESAQLTQVAKALQEMDVQAASGALKQVQLPASEENISQVTHVMQVTREMSQCFTETVQIQLSTSEKAALKDIQSALTAYREHETPVESRFGESIKNVENQIQDLLALHGMEISTVNIEAAKALIISGIEVSQENLQQIQEIVIKLNTFLEEMTPIQAAALIKEGINPLEHSIEELLNEISDSKISGLKNSVAETIVAMEKANEINEEQKEGLIGLYRILQRVSRQKEEVLGYLYRNQLPVNLENLQLAAKYVGEHQSINQLIDDSTGEVEEVLSGAPTAGELIQSSLAASQKTLEVIKKLEEMSLPITDEAIHKVSKMSALLYPYIKEQFKQNLGKFDGMNTLPESFLEKIQVAQNTSSDLLNYMSQQEIPLTLSNIFWMEQMSKDPDVYGEMLEGLGLLKSELPESLKELEEELALLEEEVRGHKEECTLLGDIHRYKSYKQAEDMLRFQQKRIESEGLYQIPFIVDGERKLMNLYVQNNQEASKNLGTDHLKAVISYPTKHLGMVKAFIEIQGENIGFKIEAESIHNIEVLESESSHLLEKLSAIGYCVKHRAFEKGNIAAGENQNDKQELLISNRSLFEQMI